MAGPARDAVLETYAALPLRFEKNVGQAATDVRFLARRSGITVALTDEGATLALRRPTAKAEPAGRGPREEPEVATVSLRFEGANPDVRIEGTPSESGRASYYLGRDPSGWRRDVAMVESVTYRGLYPGIDARFYGNGGQLEYDLVIAPGARPDVVQVSFDGADRVSLDEDGAVVLDVAGQQIRQLPPVVYQKVDGARRQVNARYEMTTAGHVALHVEPYDTTQPLVVDPVIYYSTYLGGNGSDFAYGVGVDAKGFAYVVGGTSSTDFPVKKPYQGTLRGCNDAFVVKLNPAALPAKQILYSTYVGGTNCESAEDATVDEAGAVYVTGFTSSTDFPNTTGNALDGKSDAFVFKLDSSGALRFATYYGAEDSDYGRTVAVGATSGPVAVAGSSYSLYLATPGGEQPSHAGDTLFYTLDQGQTWATKERDRATDALYNVAIKRVVPISGHPDWALAATEAGLFRTEDGGSTWSVQALSGRQLADLLEDPSDPDTWYAIANQNFLISFDGGYNWWTKWSMPVPGLEPGTDERVPRDVGADDGHDLDAAVPIGFGRLSAGPTALYGGGSDTLYTSTDLGATWTTRSFGGVGTVSRVVVDPLHPGTLFVGATPLNVSGGVWKSEDQGSTWSKLTGPDWVVVLVFDPSDPSVLYAAGRGIWKTTDGGSTWSAVSGVGVEYYDDMVVDPADPLVLYVATRVGAVLVSRDGGATFSDPSSGPGTSSTVTLAAAPGRVYAGGAISSDAFFALFDRDTGALSYGTFYGGTQTDTFTDLAADAFGGWAVAGSTLSAANFPQTGSFGAVGGTYSDAVVGRFVGQGTTDWMLRVSGTFFDEAYAVATDTAGNVYATGYTQSTDFPTVGPFQATYRGVADAFLTKIASDGTSIVYSTYLGGIAWDSGSAVVIDPSGNAWVVGSTQSSDFPLKAPLVRYPGDTGKYNVFVTKFGPLGDTLLFSTYLGGSSDDTGKGAAFGAKKLYVAGYTSSTNFKTVRPKMKDKPGTDAFLTIIK